MQHQPIITFPQTPLPKCTGASMAVLTASDADVVVRRVCLDVEGSIPLHSNTIAHQQVVLSGRGSVQVGDASFTAEAGDFLYIPAGEAHAYRTLGDTPYEFLCIISTATDSITLATDTNCC